MSKIKKLDRRLPRTEYEGPDRRKERLPVDHDRPDISKVFGDESVGQELMPEDLEDGVLPGLEVEESKPGGTSDRKADRKADRKDED